MAMLTRRSSDPLRLLDTWDPLEAVRDLIQVVPYESLLANRTVEFVPRADVRETQQSYVIEADIPGIEESDLDITCSGNRLTISGRREESRTEDETYHVCERARGSFTRSFLLPTDVDMQAIEATVENGILRITVPKHEKQRARRIELKNRRALGESQKAGKGAKKEKEQHKGEAAE